MNNIHLEEKAKYMPTQDILTRLREVKNIRDNAEEEFLVLATEFWNRIPPVEETKVKKKGAR